MSMAYFRRMGGAQRYPSASYNDLVKYRIGDQDFTLHGAQQIKLAYPGKRNDWRCIGNDNHASRSATHHRQVVATANPKVHVIAGAGSKLKMRGNNARLTRMRGPTILGVVRSKFPHCSTRGDPMICPPEFRK